MCDILLYMMQAVYPKVNNMEILFAFEAVRRSDTNLGRLVN